MAKYIYDGPIMMFGRYIGNWHGETTADTKAKAVSNLEYQCKSKNNRNPGVKLNIVPTPKYLKTTN